MRSKLRIGFLGAGPRCPKARHLGHPAMKRMSGGLRELGESAWRFLGADPRCPKARHLGHPAMG